MRISVIMPVYLGGYESYGGSRGASNPGVKFMRAVKSFLHQSYEDAELIIVSDGDRLAEDTWAHLWVNNSKIHFKYINKQPTFSGIVRQTGIEMAKGDVICYLDHDDKFGENHLQIISDNFDTEKYDWVYYNDYTVHNAEFTDLRERDNLLTLGRIGTSSIAHKRSLNIVWGDGYGHDFAMIEKYLLPHPSVKIPTPQYYVAHIPGAIDF
ncbi:MAG: glycosyltransferase family 2 protein [Prolixibacteraceae bacterium]|nr:glycosyltransferase family 2 protein [Prolixibacteraceae bacterium]